MRVFVLVAVVAVVLGGVRVEAQAADFSVTVASTETAVGVFA